MVKFSIKKIPNSFQSLTNIPIAYSIAQILNRCFSFLYYISTKSPLSNNIHHVVNNLANELFAQSNLPQVKCLIENMSEVFFKSSSESISCQSLPNCITYLAVFLSSYHKILLEDSSNLPVANKSSENSANFDKSDILKIYSIFKITSRVFGNFLNYFKKNG